MNIMPYKRLAATVLVQAANDSVYLKKNVLNEIDEGGLDIWFDVLKMDKEYFRETIISREADEKDMFSAYEMSMLLNLEVTTVRNIIRRYCTVVKKGRIKYASIESLKKGFKRHIASLTNKNTEVCMAYEILRTM